MAGQQRAGVHQHDRVVVDVDDPAGRIDPLRHLVRVVHGGQTGPDVQELPDALPLGQMTHGTPQEGPRVQRDLLHPGIGLLQHVGELFVDRVVVLATQPVVPRPGLAGAGGVDPIEGIGRGGIGHELLHSCHVTIYREISPFYQVGPQARPLPDLPVRKERSGRSLPIRDLTWRSSVVRVEGPRYVVRPLVSSGRTASRPFRRR